MALSEAEELELLELEEQEAQAAKAAQPKGGFLGLKDPRDVDWLSAIKQEFTKDAAPGSLSVGANPLLSVSSPQGVGAGALGAAKNIASRAATSPIPGKVADALNVSGHATGLLSKLSSMLPGPLKKVVDVGTGVAGRAGAYSNPYTGVPQGISDAARVTQGAQGLLAKALDADPGKLGAAVKGIGQLGIGGAAANNALSKLPPGLLQQLEAAVAGEQDE